MESHTRFIRALGFGYKKWLNPGNWFHGLSDVEAKKLLDLFLKQVEDHIDKCNFESRISSIIDLDVTVKERLSKFACSLSCRDAISLSNEEVQFDDFYSGELLMIGHLVGSSFVRVYNLEWGLGQFDTQLANLPCVRGFNSNLEFSVFTIIYNLSLDFIDSEEKGVKRLEQVLGSWKARLPG